MKLAAFFATSFLLVSLTEGTSFVPLHEDEAHAMDSLRPLKISMYGLRGEPTESDLEVVNDALIKAFNQAHAQGEYVMSDFVSTSFKLIPADGPGFGGLVDGSEVSGFGLVYGWANAPYQPSHGVIDGLIGGKTNLFRDANAVEDLLCQFIAEEGGPALSHVHSCKLYPLKRDARSIISDLKSGTGKKRGVDYTDYDIAIYLPGLSGEDAKTKEKDWFSAWGDDLIAAYNEVHKDEDNYMADFTGTGFDINDDDNNLRAGLQEKRGSYYGVARDSCKLCRRSSDNALELSKEVPFDHIHEVEKLFCSYVANTKGMGLDKVHDCKIEVKKDMKMESKVASI